jgi:hypothetical protein
METDIHFLSNNVIRNGKDREAFAPIDNAPPKPVKKPAPPKQEEKKGFNWGKLACNVLAGIAVVAVVAAATAAVVFTAGAAIPAVAGALAAAGTTAGAVAGAAFTAGMIAGTLGVAGKAASDIKNREVSDISEYTGIAAEDAFIGAVCGAIFAPFAIVGETTGLLGEIPTALQSTQNLLRTMVMGGTFNVTFDYLKGAIDGKLPNAQEVLEAYRDGALFSGFLHTGVGAISEASPFIKNACNSISSEMSDNMKALKYAWDNFEAPKGVKLGSNLGNMDFDAGKSFVDKFNEGKNAIKNGNDGAGETVDYSRPSGFRKGV